MCLGVLDKTLKLAETSIFSPSMLKNALSSTRRAERAACGLPAILFASGGEAPISVLSPYASSSKPHPQERHFLPGVNAGVSVSEK
jgi:hypothetical protein